MRPVISVSDARVWNTDARRLAEVLEPDSYDAIVTDPPYGLGLSSTVRSRQWDGPVAFDPDLWHGLKRLVKPGGLLFAFGAPRTWHRLACAVEDAGWRIIGQACRLYSHGMPKGENGDHAVDMALGFADPRPIVERTGSQAMMARRVRRDGVYEPQSEAGREWDGWNASLKPAWEPILIARRAYEGSLGGNLLEHGTGMFHVDACRTGGLYPSDVIVERPWEGMPFMYCPPERDRPKVDALMVRPLDRNVEWRRACMRLGVDADATAYPTGLLDDAALALCSTPVLETVTHPTVKPLPLMRWLIRLAVRRGGCVLDPFAGSGSTLAACLSEGVRADGCELDPAYMPLIRRRLSMGVQETLF